AGLQPKEMNSDQGKEFLKIEALAKRAKARRGETRQKVFGTLASKSESSR
ncbi:hypothetical protein A2U01_0094932, partial [Trifolium medium]|nr:hypothetical protein [Trifolium medium]